MYHYLNSLLLDELEAKANAFLWIFDLAEDLEHAAAAFVGFEKPYGTGIGFVRNET